MARIAVLGAGYMGSAVTFPLAERGHEVRLWGTWLDDELVRASRAGRHPRLKRALPASVAVLDSAELARALEEQYAVTKPHLEALPGRHPKRAGAGASAS